MKNSKWFVGQINNLQDWLLNEKISKAKSNIEKQAYYTVLHKIIETFDAEIEDDKYWDNLIEVSKEF